MSNDIKFDRAVLLPPEAEKALLLRAVDPSVLGLTSEEVEQEIQRLMEQAKKSAGLTAELP